MRSASIKLAGIENKLYIITGANAGLGLQNTIDFVKRGGHVVMACRSPDKATAALQKVEEEAKTVSGCKGKAEVMQLDLSDLESVDRFSKELSKKYEKIDCLINNAGVMKCPESKTKQGFEMQIGTNHLGHFALTLKLLPLLKNAEQSRVVSVASLAAFASKGIFFEDLFMTGNPVKYEPDEAYYQSKFANVLFSLELERKLKKAGITNVMPVLAHPGATRTDLQRHSKDTLIEQIMSTFFQTPVSAGVVNQEIAAAGPDVKANDFYGPYFYLFGAPTLISKPAKANSEEDCRKLWEKSEELTGVKFTL